MAQKVTKVGIKREEGWLYFIDKEGDVSRVKMARGGQKKKAAKKVVKKTAAKKKVVKKVVAKKKR
jgi:CO dehydrogenase/acetyl-CoA synthase gamma subunit (corrinoid Fe-S protein)